MTPFLFCPRSETGYVECENEAVDTVLDCLPEYQLVYLLKAMRTTANLPFGLHVFSFRGDWRDTAVASRAVSQLHNCYGKSGTRHQCGG